MPAHFWRYRQLLKQTLNIELYFFFKTLLLHNISLLMFELRQHVIIVSYLEHSNMIY